MNRILSLFAGLMLLCIFTPPVSAQGGYEVKGVIQDQLGPVIGATIMEQGTSNGTSSSLDGDFTLSVSGPDAMVEISCIGYRTVTFKASGVPSVITLEEDTLFLDDVVVIGYGTVKKEDMTGSVVAIKSEELNRGAVVSTQDMLKGKVPGLQIIPGDGGPGSGSTIRIRGAASLNASNDPLIVIDGVPIAADGGAGMANPLETINPNDIESFTVLKDASSAAIYGSRASNGVIIITTKRGKGGRPQVSYSGSVSVQTNSKRIPTMTPEEFREYVAVTFPSGTETGNYVEGLLGDVNTDWQDLIFRTAISHDHNVSLSGNVKERMPYRASIGWTSQQGTLQTAKYDRGTVDISLAPNFLDNHLNFSVSGRGVYTNQRYADGGTVGNAAFFNPTQDPYFRNPDGSIDYSTTNGFWNYGSGRGDEFTPNTLLGVGPLSQLYDVNNYGSALRMIGNVQVDYKVHGFEALKFNLSLGMDMSEYKSHNGVNPGSFQAYSDTENRGIGQYTESRNFRRNEVLEFYANYNEEWGIHHLDVMAGYSWQNFYSSDRSVTYFNETNEQKGDDSRYPYNTQESFLISFYGRINYSIDSRYLFTFSLRNDASSRFSPKTRWGLFPSGAFAWNIKEEQFLKHVSPVSQLKLRLSAGQTGQQEIGSNYAYMAINSLSTNVYQQYYMGNAGYQFYLTPGAYDPNIRWETTTTYNAGIDFGFLDDRITGNVDAYLRQTDDLLNSVITPMGANFGNTVLTNIGSMQNKGIEFSLNVIPVETEDWHLSIGFNGTFQDTKFTKLNNTDDPDYAIQVGSINKGTGSMLSVHKVGYAPYSYRTFQQIYDSEGNPVQNALVDRDGDGQITDNDRYISGKSPNAKFYYGLNVKLTYRNWDFGFNGHGSAGNWLFNDFASANSTSNLDVNAGNLPNFAKYVKTTGFTGANSGEQWYSDMFLENASFFRLDDVNIGYTFRNIKNWGGDIRLAFSAQNVFVITGYSGVDPELPGTTGIDGTIWPRPRTYSLRVNVNF